MIRDRVQQISTTSGTGPLYLDGGAVDGYRAFAGPYEDGDTLYYCVIDGVNWEVIFGTFHLDSPSYLTRDRTLGSSNGGSPVNFSNGNKQVFNGIPAEMMGALQGHLKGGDSSNVADAFAVALPIQVPALLDWVEASIRMKAAPGGAATLAIGDSASKPLRRGHDIPIASGDWAVDDVLRVRHDANLDHHIWLDPPHKMGVKTIATDTYTIIASDCDRLLRFTHASGCAVALPQITAANEFRLPFNFDYVAVGGSLVFTPTTSQIDGAASLAVLKGSSGEIRSHGTDYWSRRNTDAPFSLPVIASAVTRTMLAADKGSEINFTVSSTKLDLLAAATAGNGATVAVRNSAASGDVTIDPNGAETLDGLATRLLRPGDWVLIRCDGTAWRTIAGAYSFESAEITPALSSVATVTHGLGEKPNRYRAVFRCKTAEGNWSVGDEIDYDITVLAYGAAVSANATSVIVTMQQTYAPGVGDKSTGSGFTIDYTKWKLAVYASVSKG